MDQPEEALEQIAIWFSEEGLAPDSPKEAQVCLLWSALQRTRSRLHSVTWDLDTQRSQHSTEMAEVRKSLEKIHIFTEHKDVLTQEIQDENNQLKDQLGRVISLQDSQISEVAKMLYQQGLTELIHSSPSEQVAYLLVERASLLESSDDRNNRMGDGNTDVLVGTEAHALNSNAEQSCHKGAPHHGQSPWKRLFGLHKASHSKNTFIPIEARHLASSIERECSRLERDLEEGSRRLGMAHNEIRRLTDELESAHLTQRAYEIVELRKAKELNDRLDLEIRALRSRVRTLDAERSSLQQMVGPLQERVEQLESALQEQLQLHTQQVHANGATELAESQPAEVVQSNQTCRHLQEELTAQTRCLLEKEETAVSLQREVVQLEAALQEQQQQLLTVQDQTNLVNELAAVHSLKQQLDTSHYDLNNIKATIFTTDNNVQDQKLWGENEQRFENTHCQLKDDKEVQTQREVLQNKEIPLRKECPDSQETVKTLLASQDECETLKKEICETLKCLDKERSKYHEVKEKHKAKLCRAKHKCDEESMWRDEKIKNLERQLSLCSHSLSKEKELIISITVENEKLLVERRRLLQQLNEEEHNKKDSNLTASLSKCRVDFLEMENKKLGNKILHMSNQIAVLERALQNMQSLHFAEELKKTSNCIEVFKSLAVQTSSGMMPEMSEIQGLFDKSQRKQTDVTSSRHCFISGPQSAEMGYLNLTSAQRHSDPSSPPAALSNSDSFSWFGSDGDTGLVVA
ncbi:coiled-coil domain-containing protein 30 [Cyclopterus lumpus]|uniref:coiled-coil domain-containing protein 30 n=1 Tax=Cyclopterus lumpus TaxID=8103 RepID=UPI00148747C5|nr:coiled-coil domain-containing protein 30 [Cyclopterus lumpus]